MFQEKSRSLETRSGRGEGSQYLSEEDSTEIFYKMAESFLKNNQNKNKMNEYLFVFEIAQTLPG